MSLLTLIEIMTKKTVVNFATWGLCFLGAFVAWLLLRILEFIGNQVGVDEDRNKAVYMHPWLHAVFEFLNLFNKELWVGVLAAFIAVAIDNPSVLEVHTPPIFEHLQFRWY